MKLALIAWLSVATPAFLLEDNLADGIWDLGKQVPALIVLGWIVRTYTQRQSEYELRQLERDKMFSITLREMGSECHEVQRKSTAALERNTTVLNQVKDLLR